MASTPLSSQTSPLTSDKPTRWLVTGGCGFIGTALIKRLVKEGGHQIRILDNLSVGTRDDLARVCEFEEIEKNDLLKDGTNSISGFPASQPPSLPAGNSVVLFVGDIQDADPCTAACDGVDVVVHLAANTGVPQSLAEPRRDMESNVIGTFNMLEAARQSRVKRFVFASSGAPIGECTPPIHEEMPCRPVSPYGASKLAGEAYCSSFYRSYGLETVALRFGNVYGPGSTHKGSVVAKFIRQAVNGETLEIYGDGTQTRDFIYIDDLIDAVFKAATLYSTTTKDSSQTLTVEAAAESRCPESNLSSHLSPLTSASNSIAGEVFQIATNRESTVNELVEVLAPALKEQGVEGFRVIHGEVRRGDVKRNFSDTRKAEERLEWRAAVDLKTGIEKTVEWFLRSAS